MDNVKESGYIGDEDYFLIECEQCGANFQTQNENHCFCSRRCYRDAKFEYEQD